MALTFPPPAVVGGEAPVTTTCAPVSGGAFPIGPTTVTCTALDSKRQAASCQFVVSVTKAPSLAATTFVAFGDSITEGVTANCNRTLASMSFAETMMVLPRAANDPWAYPNVLQALLRSAYSAQSPVVSNRGSSGEPLSEGVTRLPGVLDRDAPQVLLLQEGANDVNQGRSPDSIAAALRAMVREARTRGIQVFVGTLLPQRPLGVLGSCRGFGAENVAPVNERLRAMVASEGATLVDLHEAFGGAPGDLIGPDGLHPSEAGYRKMAESFFAALRQRLEN